MTQRRCLRLCQRRKLVIRRRWEQPSLRMIGTSKMIKTLADISKFQGKVTVKLLCNRLNNNCLSNSSL